MSGDIPSITSSGYSTSTLTLANATTLANAISATGGAGGSSLWDDKVQQHRGRRSFSIAENIPLPKEKEMIVTKRLIQVYIVDPDENVPVEDSLIYKDEALRLTDMTDQELYYEVDIKPLLATHNEKRVKLINKKVKERTEYLEPARIRDLRMVVVKAAEF